MSLGDRGGYQHILDYLRRSQAENPDFYYATQGDDENGFDYIFWADAASRTNSSFFGDAIIFDTFRIHQGKVTFASFTGLNHHGQPVLFGSALLCSDLDAVYIWLFKTWLQATSVGCPVSITTEPDGYVQMAVSQVFPFARHCYFKQSVLEEIEENLNPIYHSYPTLETELRNCINKSETVNEFESRWDSLLGQYYLTDNEWLQSMYAARHQWVPVYMRDTFFGELSAAEGNAGRNSYFHGFVDTQTTIQDIVQQYEKAVASWHEKELKADDDTAQIIPSLKTPLPIERQAANIYTRRIFLKFQEELVESLANHVKELEDSETVDTFRVAKFGEEDNAHIVTFNPVDTRATCSCQMSEFSGIVCRHALAVFRAKNVPTLPAGYVLRRWTRNARNGGGMDKTSLAGHLNSRDFRYNNLRQEAMKLVEEGAKSIHAYNVAMGALWEAAKKLHAEKDRGKEGGNVSTPAKCGTRDPGVNELKSSESMLLQDEKAKTIQELRAELESTNELCRIYQDSILAVLKDAEDQKLKLSEKVQTAKICLRE